MQNRKIEDRKMQDWKMRKQIHLVKPLAHLQ